MDAGLVTAIGMFLAAPLTAAAAIYGHRAAGRAQQEASRAQRDGVVITGYDGLAARLTNERDKAERDQAAAEARASAAEARASAAEAQVFALQAEVSRLESLLRQHGGTP